MLVIFEINSEGLAVSFKTFLEISILYSVAQNSLNRNISVSSVATLCLLYLLML